MSIRKMVSAMVCAVVLSGCGGGSDEVAGAAGFGDGEFTPVYVHNDTDVIWKHIRFSAPLRGAWWDWGVVLIWPGETHFVGEFPIDTYQFHMSGNDHAIYWDEEPGADCHFDAYDIAVQPDPQTGAFTLYVTTHPSQFRCSK